MVHMQNHPEYKYRPRRRKHPKRSVKRPFSSDAPPQPTSTSKQRPGDSAVTSAAKQRADVTKSSVMHTPDPSPRNSPNGIKNANGAGANMTSSYTSDSISSPGSDLLTHHHKTVDDVFAFDGSTPEPMTSSVSAPVSPVARQHRSEVNELMKKFSPQPAPHQPPYLRRYHSGYALGASESCAVEQALTLRALICHPGSLRSLSYPGHQKYHPPPPPANHNVSCSAPWQQPLQQQQQQRKQQQQVSLPVYNDYQHSCGVYASPPWSPSSGSQLSELELDLSGLNKDEFSQYLPDDESVAFNTMPTTAAVEPKVPNYEWMPNENDVTHEAAWNPLVIWHFWLNSSSRRHGGERHALIIW